MNNGDYVGATICDEKMKNLESRIDKIESVTDELHKLAIAVERLSVSVENMLKEQAIHETRLGTLESRDSEMWRYFVKYIITAVAGVVVGYMMHQVGL